MEFNEMLTGEKYLFQSDEIKIIKKTKTISRDIDGNNEAEYKLKVVSGSGNTFEVISCKRDFDLINPLKPKLPETGLVVSDDEIAIKTSKNEAYGFNDYGSFTVSSNWGFSNTKWNWRPATEEDEKRWRELLIEEAKRRGYKEGAKTENGVCGDNFFMNHPSRLSVALQGCKAIGFNIMSNGKWAEIIEDEKPKDNHLNDANPYLTARDHFSKKLIEVYEEISKKWVHKSMPFVPFPTCKPSQTQQFTERLCDSLKNRKQPKTDKKPNYKELGITLNEAAENIKKAAELLNKL